MATSVETTAAEVQLRRFVTVAEEFVAGIERSDLDARVPACPDWSTYDLIRHLGNVHAWAATIVETGSPAAEQDDAPRHRVKAAARWYAGKAGDLYEVLRVADPSAPCWNFTFGATGVTGFWLRRQVHETAVHRIDLAQANPHPAEVPAGITPDLAADGVDEVLTVFLRRMQTRGLAASLLAPVVIETTDVQRRWTVRPGQQPSRTGDYPVVTPGSAGVSADVIRGRATDLYPLLWKRVRLDQTDVELIGNRSRLSAFLGSRLTA